MATASRNFTNEVRWATTAARVSRSDESRPLSPPVESKTTSHSLCFSELAQPKAFHSTSRFWDSLLSRSGTGRGLTVRLFLALLLELLPTCVIRSQAVFFSLQYGAFIAPSKAAEIISVMDASGVAIFSIACPPLVLMTSQPGTSDLGSIPLPGFFSLDVIPLDIELSGRQLTVFSNRNDE